MEIICGRTASCAFRAYERYFVDKPRFSATGCPTCSGPLVVVEDGTDIPVPGARIISRQVDGGPRRGSIVVGGN